LICQFIDGQRAAGRRVESVCQVLREQGLQAAPRTYRAWKRNAAPARAAHKSASARSVSSASSALADIVFP
jgi:hypothetical protein